MSCSGENVLLGLILCLLAINCIGLSLPVWYKKDHEHNTNTTATTDEGCTVHMNIQEGLWQRSCEEKYREGKHCEIDIQEWCDSLDFPEFNTYVVSNEIFGDVFLLFAFATILRSKCIMKAFNLEMVSVEIGLAGVLMIIGSSVYMTAGSEIELDYHVQDLHVGWGLCASAGITCLFVCFVYMCKHVRSRRRMFTRGYLPLNDLDDQLIEV